jgi:hypothetical protein
MLYPGLDLNCAADICHPAGNSLEGDIDEHGQAGVCADHGTSVSEEVARLLEAAPGIKYKAALSVAYGAGLRASEVVSLKVSDSPKSEPHAHRRKTASFRSRRTGHSHLQCDGYCLFARFQDAIPTTMASAGTIWYDKIIHSVLVAAKEMRGA